ncbi:transposase zinc-binding domain-containing protein, partial [Tepidibacter formicigenes]
MTKVTLKKILQDNWQNFLKKKIKRIPKVIRADVIETVEKAMDCGRLEKGYTEYMCLECMESKRVGFTCKSKFCTR